MMVLLVATGYLLLIYCLLMVAGRKRKNERFFSGDAARTASRRIQPGN